MSATRRMPDLIRLLRHTDAPLGAYYVLLHGWERLLAVVHIAPTEWWLRFPSAAAGIGAVALTVMLAGRWFDPRIGLIAGCVLAVHPLAVFYAHDARPYTLAMVFMLAAIAMLGPALARPTVPRLAAYWLLLTLSVYAHMFAVLAIVAHAVVIVRHRGGGRWRFAVVGIAFVAAVAPLMMMASQETGEIGWIPRPSVKNVASFTDRLAGGPMAIAVLLLAIAAAMVAWRARHITTDGARSPRALVATWALIPPIVLVAVDIVRPVLVVRYALVAVPAIAILVAAGFRRIGGRLGAGLIVAVLLAGFVTSVIQQDQPYKYEDFRAATARIIDTGQFGDGVLFVPASMRIGYDHYRAIVGPTAGRAPADIATVHGEGPTIARSISGSEIGPGAIVGAIAGHPRVYLVAAGDDKLNPTDSAKFAELNADYSRVWTRHYGGISVTLYIRDDQLVGGPETERGCCAPAQHPRCYSAIRPRM